jgi:tetratricopeptide (TPR) repeat protein
MTAVLPSGATLALAAPTLVFSSRSRRNIVIGVGAALAIAAVAILFAHSSPADHAAPIATGAPAAPHATAGAPPAIQPLRTDSETAPARAVASAPASAVAHGNADVEREAAETAIPAGHAKVRIAHHAKAHERRVAKHERHAKRARHETRHVRRTEVASRATPSPADDGEARASYQRGNALLFAGDAAGAVAAYRKAVELAPADPIGYRGLGLAYEQQGETGAAARALHKYLKLAPGAADREIISRRIARLGHAAAHP